MKRQLANELHVHTSVFTTARRPLPSASNCILTKAVPPAKTTPSVSLPRLPVNDQGSLPLQPTSSNSQLPAFWFLPHGHRGGHTQGHPDGHQALDLLYIVNHEAFFKLSSHPVLLPSLRAFLLWLPNLLIDRSQGSLLRAFLCSLLPLTSFYIPPAQAITPTAIF